MLNHKRLFRIYREAGLSVKRSRHKKLIRTGVSRPVLTAPNDEWALDFVSDGLASGRSLRVLTVVDAFTCECLALEVDTSLASERVTRVLDGVMDQRGRPKSLRMDNGPELTSRHFLAWCLDRKVTANYIQPGKPVQNSHIESFNGRFRDECLRMPVGSVTCSKHVVGSRSGERITTALARTAPWGIEHRTTLRHSGNALRSHQLRYRSRNRPSRLP